MAESFTEDASPVSIETSHGATPVLETIASDLEHLKATLHNVLSDREDDFLQLGANLMDFSNRSTSLSQGVSELALLASGEEIKNRVEDLHAFLGIINSHCKDMKEATTVKGLADVAQNISELKEIFQDFARVIKSLRMLGISTRIESARLGDHGRAFTSLADDVDKLVARIEASSVEIVSKSDQLIATTLKVQDSAQNLVGSQNRRLERVTTSLSENITDLSGIIDTSEHVSQNLITHSGTISANTSQAVTSLQCHDMVRQQVEHVEESIHDALLFIRSGADNGDSNYSEQEILTFVSSIATLQASQLDHAGTQFNQAITEFQRQLQNIADVIDAFILEIMTLRSTDRDDQGSVLQAIKTSMSQVIENVNAFMTGIHEQQTLIAPVASTVADMDSSARQVQDLGDEIELISLNASIKSACVGDQGRAMGVLAHEIQRLSMQTKNHTGKVLVILSDLARTSATLHTSSNQQERLEDLKTSSSQQETSLSQLVGLNTQMTRQFDTIFSQGQEIREDIQNLAQGLNLHEIICSRLSDTREKLLQLAEQSAGELTGPPASLPQEFDELLHRYTMESERLVHQTTFQKTGVANGAPADLSPSDGGIDLFDDDDGIDLFSDDDGIDLFDDDDGIELF